MSHANSKQTKHGRRAFTRWASLLIGLSLGTVELTDAAADIAAPDDGADTVATPEQGCKPDDAAPHAMRNVLVVGNSVSGTVSFIDDHTFRNLGSVNVIPDLATR